MIHIGNKLFRRRKRKQETVQINIEKLTKEISQNNNTYYECNRVKQSRKM